MRRSVTLTPSSNPKTGRPFSVTNLIQRKTIDRTDNKASAVYPNNKLNNHIKHINFFETRPDTSQSFTNIPVKPHLSYPIQAKLKIGQPDDKYEQEADRVAEQVMRTPDPSQANLCTKCKSQQQLIQNKYIHTLAGNECSECNMRKRKGLQAKPRVGEPDDAYERAADRVADRVTRMQRPITPRESSLNIQRIPIYPQGQAFHTPSSVERELNNPGKPLSDVLKIDMEQRFGYDFSGVRIHFGTAAEQSAQDINAHAYAVGQDIVFGKGQFSPESYKGRRLLAHELTHVIQQSGCGAYRNQDNSEQSQSLVSHKGILSLNTVVMRDADCPWSVGLRQRIVGLHSRFADRDDELGTLEDICSLTESRANEAFLILENIFNARMGHGLVRGWLRGLDDLSSSRIRRRGRYLTVLHYALNLQALSQSSMGMGYVEAARFMNRQSQVRLAGAQMAVHPRMVYFAAAAQVEMDDRDPYRPQERINRGHYLAPGAVFEELRLVHSTARTVATRALHRRRPVFTVGSLQLYENLRERVEHIINIRNAQSGEDVRASQEHRELVLQSYLDDDRISRLQGLFAIPVYNDISAVTALNNLVTILEANRPDGNLPGRRQEHGWWAVDTHGTEHAMGIALDLFNARGRTNFAPPREVWRFLHYLISQHSSEYPELAEISRGTSESALSNLRRQIYSNPEYLYALTNLIQVHAREERNSVLTAARERQTPEYTVALSLFRRSRRRLHRGLLNRYDSLRRITRRRSHWFERIPEVRHSARETYELLGGRNGRGVIHRRMQGSPEEIRQFVQPIINKLDELVQASDQVPVTELAPHGHTSSVTRTPDSESGSVHVEADRRTRSSANRQQTIVSDLDPLNESSHITEQLDTISQQNVRDAYVRSRIIAVGRDLQQNGRGRSWLNQMTRPGARLYDQPRVFTAGLSAVEGTAFYGSHHWEWIGTRGRPNDHGILQDEYENALLADMHHRAPEQMRRILQIMVQSPVGRRVLLGHDAEPDINETQASSNQFINALETWASANGVNLNLFLDEVRQQAPQQISGGNVMNQMLRALYSRGYYELANQLADENPR